MIINWCVIALAALIIGGITTIATKDKDCFGVAILLNILIGFGYLIAVTQ